MSAPLCSSCGSTAAMQTSAMLDENTRLKEEKEELRREVEHLKAKWEVHDGLICRAVDMGEEIGRNMARAEGVHMKMVYHVDEAAYLAMAARAAKAEERMREVDRLLYDATFMILALRDDWWPYVHQWCTIETTRALFKRATIFLNHLANRKAAEGKS